jgi:beta-phosphoglucomutase-like phosphatase (HAD superfamily)
VIAAVVFDFDGVLADSEGLHLRAYQDVLSGEGVSLATAEYYERYLGFDDVGVFTELGADRGWALDSAAIRTLVERKGRAYTRLIAGGGVLYPAAPACIERMAAAFPLGIASGALRQEIEAILAAAGLAGRFRFIVSAEDTPRSKPAPDPYRLAAARHGLAPETCLAIEDSHAGLESARSAGLRTIAVTHTYHADTLRAADRVVRSLDEITPQLVAGL